MVLGTNDLEVIGRIYEDVQKFGKLSANLPKELERLQILLSTGRGIQTVLNLTDF